MKLSRSKCVFATSDLFQCWEGWVFSRNIKTPRLRQVWNRTLVHVFIGWNGMCWTLLPPGWRKNKRQECSWNKAETLKLKAAILGENLIRIECQKLWLSRTSGEDWMWAAFPACSHSVASRGNGQELYTNLWHLVHPAHNEHIRWAAVLPTDSIYCWQGVDKCQEDVKHPQNVALKGWPDGSKMDTAASLPWALSFCLWVRRQEGFGMSEGGQWELVGAALYRVWWGVYRDLVGVPRDSGPREREGERNPGTGAGTQKVVVYSVTRVLQQKLGHPSLVLCKTRAWWISQQVPALWVVPMCRHSSRRKRNASTRGVLPPDWFANEAEPYIMQQTMRDCAPLWTQLGLILAEWLSCPMTVMTAPCFPSACCCCFWWIHETKTKPKRYGRTRTIRKHYQPVLLWVMQVSTLFFILLCTVLKQKDILDFSLNYAEYQIKNSIGITRAALSIQ